MEKQNENSGIISTIQDAETAMVIWKIFHKLSLEAMNHANKIKEDKLNRELADFDRRLWRLEMKVKGVIQGGGKKRKNRKKPKFKLIKTG